jgi:BAI1-associated protein 3
MLGITSMMGCQAPPLSPQPATTPRAMLPEPAMDSLESPECKLRKHGSFRLSFKRKSQHRDSMGPMPAKIIKATSVKNHTLSPKWNEKFKL